VESRAKPAAAADKDMALRYLHRADIETERTGELALKSKYCCLVAGIQHEAGALDKWGSLGFLTNSS